VGGADPVTPAGGACTHLVPAAVAGEARGALVHCRTLSKRAPCHHPCRMKLHAGVCSMSMAAWVCAHLFVVDVSDRVLSAVPHCAQSERSERMPHLTVLQCVDEAHVHGSGGTQGWQSHAPGVSGAAGGRCRAAGGAGYRVRHALIPPDGHANRQRMAAALQPAGLSLPLAWVHWPWLTADQQPGPLPETMLRAFSHKASFDHSVGSILRLCGLAALAEAVTAFPLEISFGAQVNPGRHHRAC